MRTLGELMMIAAALALLAVAFAAGYQPYYRLRQQRRSLDWRTYRFPTRLKYFDEHSPSTVVFSLLIVAAVGFVLRHYG
jgi:hypothetical protein